MSVATKPRSIYWQYNKPLNCPKGHEMLWLGSAFWICGKGKCNRIYVQETANAEEKTQEKVNNP
jgi:hypothetical protein